MTFEALLAREPPPRPGLADSIRARFHESNDRIVVIDDDPTGSQTVSGVEVLLDPSDEKIDRVMAAERLFYVLTDSRSLSEVEAVALNQKLGIQLAAAAARRDVHLRLASRSDSTLRGHFPAEVEALVRGAGIRPRAILLVPSFPDGGRYTLGNIHYARVDDGVVPVAETAYARDPVFGYTRSHLAEWVEEKSHGRIPAASVASIDLGTIRRRGPGGVAQALATVPFGAVVIVNAVAASDLEVVACAVQDVESASAEIVYRTSAAFVRARCGLREQPLLSREEALSGAAQPDAAALVICGSHVPLSTAQVAAAVNLPGVVPVEIDVDNLQQEGSARVRAIADAATAATNALVAGKHAIVFTTRQYRPPRTATPLDASRLIAGGLAEIVERLGTPPAYIIGKGGTTSSVIARAGLALRSAFVRGQVAPGISVWVSDDGRFPHVPYIVFPGNVGDSGTLARLLTALSPGRRT